MRREPRRAIMNAIEQFNEVFGFHFREPVDEHTRRVMIDFARESGRGDIADRLQAEAGAGGEGATATTLAESRPGGTFPGGRW